MIVVVAAQMLPETKGKTLVLRVKEKKMPAAGEAPMLHNDETQKHTLIEEAAGLAASDAAALSEDARAIGDFIRSFYEHVPPADIASRAPSDLSEAALSLWRFAAEREPGRPKVRVLPPSEAKEAWPGRAASCRSSTTTCRSSWTASAPR